MLAIQSLDIGTPERSADTRPWGTIHLLYEHPGTKIKVLTLSPGMAIPKQLHRYHIERWLILAGEGTAALAYPKEGYEATLALKPGHVVDIALGQPHGLRAGAGGLQFLEVQQSCIVPGGDAEIQKE